MWKYKNISYKKMLFHWEWVLVLLFIIVMLINSMLSPYFFDVKGLVSATATFLDKGLIVLPMALVIILGNIDISVSSTLALSSVIMAVSYNAGLSMPLAMILCLLVATVCGFINGYLIVKFTELSSVIITLSTMIIYRGLAYVILEDQASGNFPSWFSFLGWGSIKGIPIVLIVFILFAILFYLLLHKTIVGREIYAIGSNKIASLYSGIKVKKIELFIFILTGFMVGVTALFLSSRLGSTRPNLAIGYELDVIAMTVLGGVSTAGGKGKVIGVVIAIFLIGYLRYGLGLINIDAQVLLVLVGGLLIFAVLAPNMIGRINYKKIFLINKKIT